jgi:restriction endonuclease Mrr
VQIRALLSRLDLLELIYKVNLKSPAFFACQGFQAPEAVLSGFPESLALRELQRLNKSALTTEAKKEAVRDGVPPIELVDGENLIEMLESLELGLMPVQSYKVDAQFFEAYR